MHKIDVYAPHVHEKKELVPSAYTNLPHHLGIYLVYVTPLVGVSIWIFFTVLFGQENLSILSSFDTLPTTPIKKPWAYDFYLGYFSCPMVHLLTPMLSFLCPPKKSKSTLGSRVWQHSTVVQFTWSAIVIIRNNAFAYFSLLIHMQY